MEFLSRFMSQSIYARPKFNFNPNRPASVHQLLRKEKDRLEFIIPFHRDDDSPKMIDYFFHFLFHFTSQLVYQKKKGQFRASPDSDRFVLRLCVKD